METKTENAIETLEEKVLRLENEKKALQKANEDLQQSSAEEIGNLSEALDKAKKVADVAEPTITVDKKDYKIIGTNFTYRRKGESSAREYSLEDLKADKALQAELVKIGAGFLVLKK